MFYKGLKGSGYRNTRLFRAVATATYESTVCGCGQYEGPWGPCFSRSVGARQLVVRERPSQKGSSRTSRLGLMPDERERTLFALPHRKLDFTSSIFHLLVSSPTSLLLAQLLYLTPERGSARAQTPAMTLDDLCLLLATNPYQWLDTKARKI